MSQDAATFSPSRQATRAPVDLAVRLSAAQRDLDLEARCDNLSIGGMFVLTEATADAGEQMRFELDVSGDIDGAGDEVIRGLAEVVWCQPASEHRSAGVGFKFRAMEPRDRQLIFKLVSRHIKERLAARQPAPMPRPSGSQPARLHPGPAGPPAFEIASDDISPPAGEPLPSPPSPPPAPPPSPPPSPPPISAESGAFEPPPAGSGAFEPPPATTRDSGAVERSMGFSDLGGPAEPELLFRSEPEENFGGPSSLDDALGDSLLDQARDTGSRAVEVVHDGLLDPEETPDPSTRAESRYVRHLGDDHFDHRPQPKKERPVVIIGVLLLLLLGALGYLFGDRIFDLGGTSAPRSAAADSPPSAGPAAIPEQPLQTLDALAFRRAGDALEIVVTVSRGLEEGGYESFRLDGENPRHVIKLFYLERGDEPQLSVGEGGVRQVRTGWHAAENGRPPQMHVVIDLDDPQVRVVEVRTDGPRLVVRLE